jgi:hypothetical protein
VGDAGGLPFLATVNHARYAGQAGGFYESYFQRANHPTRPLAFWIRYTLFCPKAPEEPALAELWAIYFDGESGRHVGVKREYPLADARFDRSSFHVRIADTELGEGRLIGTAASDGHSVGWNLRFGGDAPPLLLLRQGFYEKRFPAAKSLVGLPLARFVGDLTIDGKIVEVADWIGSQNHNWGTRHTDRYAWGQIAGFDGHPGSFLEVATARLKLGPFWLPPLTPIVLRHDGREHRFNALLQSVRAHGAFDYFRWSFGSKNREASIQGTIEAPREAFVGLRYRNPPGGIKNCLNSKIAACTVRLRDRQNGSLTVLETKNRAAFEILTDHDGHDIAMAA